MKLLCRSTFLLLALFSLSCPLHANWWDDITNYFVSDKPSGPPSIRVLVMHDSKAASLQVDGKYGLCDPYKNSINSPRFCGKKRTLETSSRGLKWGEEFPDLYQLKIFPRASSTRIVLNDVVYDTPLYVYDIGGSMSAVTEVPVEEYVSAVLASYENLHLEPEALAALAIAIRTNAYFQAFNPKNTYWSVDGQKVGYKGVVSLPARQGEAIRQTRNMVMSRTGVYEGMSTPFAAQFDVGSKESISKDVEISKISLDEANAMAQRGEDAAQILAKAFPRGTIMLIQNGK